MRSHTHASRFQERRAGKAPVSCPLPVRPPLPSWPIVCPQTITCTRVWPHQAQQSSPSPAKLPPVPAPSPKPNQPDDTHIPSIAAIQGSLSSLDGPSFCARRLLLRGRRTKPNNEPAYPFPYVKRASHDPKNNKEIRTATGASRKGNKRSSARVDGLRLEGLGLLLLLDLEQ